MSDQSNSSIFRSPFVWLAVVAVLAAAGITFWQAEREKARLKAELDRMAAEQAEFQRARDAEVKREQERQRILAEIRAQKEAEEAIRQESLAVRQAEVEKKQFVADDRYVSPQQATYQSYQMLLDQRRRDVEDRRQRYEDADNLRKARQEVERQKQYLQQREYEEQMARQRRDNAARYGR